MDPIISAAALLIALESKTAAAATPQSPDSLTSVLLKSLLLPALVSIGVFVVLEYLIKPFMRPKLQLDFDEAIPGCRNHGPSYEWTSKQDQDAVFIRIKVSNVRGPAAKSAGCS